MGDLGRIELKYNEDGSVDQEHLKSMQEKFLRMARERLISKYGTVRGRSKKVSKDRNKKKMQKNSRKKNRGRK